MSINALICVGQITIYGHRWGGCSRSPTQTDFIGPSKLYNTSLKITEIHNFYLLLQLLLVLHISFELGYNMTGETLLDVNGDLGEVTLGKGREVKKPAYGLYFPLQTPQGDFLLVETPPFFSSGLNITTFNQVSLFISYVGAPWMKTLQRGLEERLHKLLVEGKGVIAES